MTPLALEHIRFHKKAGNKSQLKKLERLLDELESHPYEGTGQPELLKYDFAGHWSRRIDHKHRLVYQINDQTVEVKVVSATDNQYEPPIINGKSKIK